MALNPDRLSTDYFPRNCTIMIDREGYPWVYLNPLRDDWRADLLGSYIDLVMWVKSIRPDCEVGLYGIVPKNDNFAGHAYRAGRDIIGGAVDLTIRGWNDYTSPIVDVVDYLMPYFYLPSNDPNASYKVQNYYWLTQPYDDMMVDWVEHCLMTTQRDFPGKKIFPLLWYQNYGDYQAIGAEYATIPVNPDAPMYDHGGFLGYDMVWTDELLTRMFVPGTLWRRLMNTIVTSGNVINYSDRAADHYKQGLRQFASWGEGAFIPWGEDYDWWVETKDFFRVHRNS